MRILSDKASASCDADEIMVSAYCARAGGGAATPPGLDGMTGASCEGEAVAVVACAKR